MFENLLRLNVVKLLVRGGEYYILMIFGREAKRKGDQGEFN